MSEIVFAGPVAFLRGAKATVFFSESKSAGDAFAPSGRLATVPVIRRLQNAIGVAYWGEDNRFPQNIEHQMSYCGIGKSALDFKARALYGNGIIPGKITGYDEKTKEEIFQPLDRIKYKVVYEFIERPSFLRWFLEHSIDWSYFSNCYPEGIFSKNAKLITDLKHQESCDSRYKQMNDDGKIDTVFLSKMWGAAKDQYAQFDPKKAIPGLLENPPVMFEVDNKFVKPVDCMDIYDSLNSLTAIADKQLGKGLGAYKSCIMPVNYYSPNKTYYQVPSWDGARLGGWVEIASKIPAMLKRMYEKAFSIKYHIEISESYFEKKFTFEIWDKKSPEAKKAEHVKLLREMDEFLSGDQNAYKTFISFYDVDPVTLKPFGNVIITEIENKSSIDKDLLISNNAGLQVLIAMQVPLPLFSSGMTGAGGQGAGSGSDIREGFLVYNSLLKQERRVLLEPLYNVAAFNREVGGQEEWESGIQFRILDTVLTTLDTGAGTTKTLS